MQEYVEERTVALSVKSGKLTGRVLAAALHKALEQVKAGKTPHGKQSVKSLMKQNGTKNAIKLVGSPKDFDRIAKEFHVDYAFYKTGPNEHLLFFKADQADAITSAFSKYTEKVMGRGKTMERPSILGQLKQFAEQVKAHAKVRERAREGAKEER